MKCNIHEVDENFCFTNKYMWPYDGDGVVLEDLFEVWTITAPMSHPTWAASLKCRVTEDTRSNLNSFDDNVGLELHNIEDIEEE